MKLNLEKIIPVKEEDLELAINKAEKIFLDNELTSEYMDARDITTEEIINIETDAKTMAELIIKNYGFNLSKEEIKEYFYNACKENKYYDFVFDEMMNKLEKDYNYSFKKINI